MKSGTLKDYSEDMYKVYFEVGERKGTALGILESFVGNVQTQSVSHLESGYELAMPIQSVPDAVSLLIERNIAIYQVVRGKKVKD